MAARSIAGQIKASFHRDRQCHLGFTNDYYTKTARARLPGLTSHHWDRWTIPDAPVVRALQIVLPASELRTFAAQEASQIEWLPALPEKCISAVSIYIVDLGTVGTPTDAKWPGSSDGAQPFGLIDIPGAERIVWAVSAHHTLNTAEIAFIEERNWPNPSRHLALRRRSTVGF